VAIDKSLERLRGLVYDKEDRCIKCGTNYYDRRMVGDGEYCRTCGTDLCVLEQLSVSKDFASKSVIVKIPKCHAEAS